MAAITFLGLGLMGTPMATRLVAAGHQVTVWNRTAERTVPLVNMGAATATTPAQAAAGAEFVITMLANPAAFEEVLFGAEGVASSLGPGDTLIDMSTVGPHEIASARERLQPGVVFVDAPVRGSVPEATNGQLFIYVGADADQFERVAPVLGALGRVEHVGPAGAGAATKLVVNTSLAASMVAFGEALSLGRALGLDLRVLLDVLENSPIGSIVKSKRANVESWSFPANFKLSLAAKDISLALGVDPKLARDLKMTNAIGSWLNDAIEEGRADLDFSAVVATILGGKRPL